MRNIPSRRGLRCPTDERQPDFVPTHELSDRPAIYKETIRVHLLSDPGREAAHLQHESSDPRRRK